MAATGALPPHEALAGSLERIGAGDADLAIVLGSGLGAFADGLGDARAIPFGEVQGMPESRVPGHAGRFVVGDVGAVRVIVQQGRVHLYEGWSPAAVTRSMRAFARLGCRAVLLTNAAGGLVPDWPVPCLMRIEDHLCLQGATPLLGGEAGRGTPYDPALGSALDDAARAAGIELRSGVYAALPGPSYETPAEVRMLARAGADAVGMSTALEALAAHAAGVRVAAVSCISNRAAGLSEAPLNHEEVVVAGAEIAEDFARLLAAAAPRLVTA